MGVAVIHPRDCLNNSSFPQPLPSSLPKMKVLTSHPAPNPKASRSGRGRPNRPKRGPLRPHDDSQATRSTSASTIKPLLNNPVMGQVKILKRGELLTDAPAPAPVVEQADQAKTDLGTMDGMISNRELSPVGGLAGFYAGSSMFMASPPPSSVPLPAFFSKKVVTDATSDLRRILRLDLQ
ncbi:uncharacterized protein LOC129318572 [Prosopis cineraria]|uniref:uncharacterized protein LOC129318572 n=1 Tax=Prosopis cineraria TaxID=364024 RepID=UPI00241092C6|nr:uncharacterized protein LOC129318572 [Prosopis cineraria]